jgi:hypothetical protein
MVLMTKRLLVLTTVIGIIVLVVLVVLRADRDSDEGPRVDRSHDCENLVSLNSPSLTITKVRVIAEQPRSTYTSPFVSRCQIVGLIDGDIRFRLLLPDRWNGRFVMGGGGGFTGYIQNATDWMANLGYASVGTNGGHDGNELSAGWALHNPVRQLNFAQLAVHRTAEVSKSIIREYYGSGPGYSYFYGCSRGGGQGLMEAQRYPTDFDGIVAGAPTFDWTGMTAEMIKNMQAAFPDPANLHKSMFSTAQLDLLGSSVLEKCDPLDGVQDGIMEDPRDCDFRLTSLPLCGETHQASICFTQEQLDVLREIYGPAVIGGEEIYPGRPYGGEGELWGWQNWITGPYDGELDSGDGWVPSLQWAFGTETAKYLIFADPDWDYTTYDFKNWRRASEGLSSMLDSVDTNLSSFDASGGKMIIWQGWLDPVVSPLRIIQYYKGVLASDQGAGEYLRLYMLPGVLHCVGGPGASRVDWLTAITQWVEKAIAPEQTLAEKASDDGNASSTRLLCPFPETAEYLGGGSEGTAANYQCTAPARSPGVDDPG